MKNWFYFILVLILVGVITFFLLPEKQKKKTINIVKTTQKEIVKAINPLLGTLKMKNLEIPVLLEDSDYDQELKKFIFTDLKRIFWYAKATVKENKDSESWQKRKILGEEYISKKKIQTDAYVPKVFENLKYNYIHTVHYQNRDHLVIPKAFVDKYRQRMDFVKKHQEMFDKLEEFCESFNTLDVNKMSRSEIMARLFFSKKNKNLQKEIEGHSLKDLRKHTSLPQSLKFHSPSTFSIVPSFDLKLAPKQLYITTSLQTQNGKIMPTMTMWPWFVYHERKWKITYFIP